MISAEKFLARLREHGHYLGQEIYTDDEGAAFLLGTTPRTLQRWREISRVICREHGPPAIYVTRWLYDVEEIVKWLNQGGMKSKTAADTSSMRRGVDKGGQR